ncbi:type II toxin-antitoxin system RelE/ParE family toxin [Asticcacaulis sp. BYS171W]|uniref:Type II toxin-antitoxin system RelE/ParE family toxin n=1 Tax=Asticcacaulis aquaticus TaxID=2984212 RepID=A0ABT5HY69_9CAUL|nr:type II toxin-antitoxin system RelE/ParE family toxin [Asticcacaulis aquaticus]MDC7685003.1 type II toxin-antitoxin system RelE/ParE family toxin [Asticcacaulis aquaticus]
MIESFADRLTEQLFEGVAVKRMDAGLQKQALRRLIYLNAAVSLEDLRVPPSNRLEALQGDRKGFYSIRVNDQWRIVFKWLEGNAHEVEFVDYH